MTVDCNSNNTLLTPGVTTKQLHYKHDKREKFNQKDIIIQFTVACFTALFDALCTLNRGGRKGGPKTAKPHRNRPKNRKPHRIFSRIPKPRVHVGHNMKADVSKTCDIF